MAAYIQEIFPVACAVDFACCALIPLTIPTFSAGVAP